MDSELKISRRNFGRQFINRVGVSALIASVGVSLSACDEAPSRGINSLPLPSEPAKEPESKWGRAIQKVIWETLGLSDSLNRR